MGIHEQTLAFREQLEETAGRKVGAGERVRYTRMIVIEGRKEWVEGTVARCYVPQQGDFRGLPSGVVSCTDHKIEVVD